MTFDPTGNSATPQRTIYSVGQLNRAVKTALEYDFPLLWVEGEISNLARPASGHWYFSLKDDKAQVRCAMFKQRNRALAFSPADGSKVLLRARVTLYEPRGDYQLIVEHMESLGDGLLRLQFEKLKQKLASERLFDSAHKQALPPFPKQVGVITSATGAALHDIVTVFRRRFPALPITVYPSQVQGETAPAQLRRALQLAIDDGRCDVLIIGRGGGSLEDLWAFNDEQLARDIFNCPIPIVSAVGHEVDFTIADFVADKRAPTPSAAAELISPDQEQWMLRLDQLEQKATLQMRKQLSAAGQQLGWWQQRLKSPQQRLHEISQRIEGLQQRLHYRHQQQLKQAQEKLSHLSLRLHQRTPSQLIQQGKEQQHALGRRLEQNLAHLLKSRQQQLAGLSRALEAVSPLATLSRGYSITQRIEDKAVITDVRQIKVGDTLTTRLQHGELQSRVEKIIEEPEQS